MVRWKFNTAPDKLLVICIIRGKMRGLPSSCSSTSVLLLSLELGRSKTYTGSGSNNISVVLVGLHNPRDNSSFLLTNKQLVIMKHQLFGGQNRKNLF